MKSANDVAVMLAEAIGGNVESFVARMNATARRLGMTRTNFVNPNGLPADAQVTTARDLAKLSRAVVRDFPQHADLWAMTDFRIGKQRLASHNSLLRSFEGADGLKTGFICDSGFNVVASATRGGTRLMAVVLGEPSSGERTVRAASLLEHGFQHYGWKSFFDPTDIDNMPMDKDAAISVVSIRDRVVSWGCGHRPKASASTRARKIKARAARAKLRKKKDAGAQARSSVTPQKSDATVKSGATKPAPAAVHKKPHPRRPRPTRSPATSIRRCRSGRTPSYQKLRRSIPTSDPGMGIHLGAAGRHLLLPAFFRRRLLAHPHAMQAPSAPRSASPPYQRAGSWCYRRLTLRRPNRGTKHR